jgi:hypothetical protein
MIERVMNSSQDGSPSGRGGRIGATAPVLAAVRSWARTRRDIVGLVYVGAHVPGAPGPYANIVVVVLTNDDARYRRDNSWIVEIDWPDGARPDGPTCDVAYGTTWSRRVALADLRLVEFAFAAPSWANDAPVDPITYLIMGHAPEILWDPEGRLARLRAALEPGLVDEAKAAEEFLRSWKGAEEFYAHWSRLPRHKWLEPMIGLVGELRRRGYDRLLRLSHRLYALELSRGVEPESGGAALSIYPFAHGLGVEGYIHDPGESRHVHLSLPTIAVSPELDLLLQQLVKERIY